MLLNYQEKHTSLNEKENKVDYIFIIHGLFGSLSNLAGVASAVKEQHNVVLLDLRNHGNSPHCQSMSYQEMASDIFELADHLSIDNFSIIGHSMGGKVAMTCALQRPERINKLIVADIAPIQYEERHQNVFNGLLALTNQIIESRKSADTILSETIKMPETRQFLLKSLRKKEDKLQLSFNLNAIIDNYDLIRGWSDFDTTFNKDTLFIKGADSDYIIPEHQADILHFFPKAKAKIISNTGHWLHAEKPKAFNRLVLQFIN